MIDEAARQLQRDEAQEVLSESAREAEKAATKTPGTFPKTPPKQKAPVASNDPDDSSSSSSSDTEDNMYEEAQPPPAPVNPPAVTIRFAPLRHPGSQEKEKTSSQRHSIGGTTQYDCT